MNAPNFRQTSAGIQLGKLLFNPSLVPSLSPLQITSLLKKAGLNIPKDVSITVDTAQIIMSGGAFVSGIQAGSEIGALSAPAANVLAATTDILGLCGLMNPNSPAAQLIRIGTDSALVMSSGGLNILADINLVLDFVGSLFTVDNRAQVFNQLYNESRNETIAWYNSRERTQFQTAALNFADYQSGKISCFDLIANIAEQSPDLFGNYFPDLKMFFPPITVSKTTTTNTVEVPGGMFWGGRPGTTIRVPATASYGFFGTAHTNESASYTLNYQTIDTSRNVVQTDMITAFLIYPNQDYAKISQYSNDDLKTYGYPKAARHLGVFDHNNPIPRMTIEDMAILSLFPPYFQFFHDDFNIKPYLISLNLTPQDFGYSDLISKQMLTGYFGKKIAPKDPAITFNGVDYFDTPVANYNLIANNKNSQIDDAIHYDSVGDIQSLLKIPRAERVITEWGILPFINQELTPTKDSASYRNIRNYWSAVQLADTMQKDPFFTDFNIEAQSVVGKFLDSAANIDAKHRKLQFLSVGRGLNKLARKNIAGFYDTTPDRLKFSTFGMNGLIGVTPK